MTQAESGKMLNESKHHPLTRIKKDIEKAQLVVVTKKQTINDIKKVYATGEKNFGENRVNELLLKKDLLPSQVEKSLNIMKWG